jgi:sigma-B regulation protein RsbU (phosphoserine phosphatase)
MKMYELNCGEIWGGIRNCDEDLGSAGLTVSLYSFASDGGKGGDVYYLSLCDHNSLTRMVVADVVGHGESVSEISTYIHDAIKTHINNVACDDSLSELNCIALEKGLDVLTTMVVAAFYQSDGNLYFANAGHPAALFRRWNETNWLQLKLSKAVHNSALGFSDQAVYSQNTIQVKSGDCLFLYSEGLIEANNKEEELFGEKRLKELLKQHPKAPPPELKHIIIDKIRRYSGGSLNHDDITIMIALID